MRDRPAPIDSLCRACREGIERSETGIEEVRSQTPDRLVAKHLAEHLKTCADCARYAEGWRAAQAALRAHHAGAAPDPDFARRVLQRLPATSTMDDLFGWAALRLLPAAAVIALLLAGAAFELGRTPAGLGGGLAFGLPGLPMPGPQDDLLTYVALSDTVATEHP